MSRLFFAAAFLLGAVAIVWMGAAFIGSDLLALTVTAIIAVVYSMGFVELVQYRQATASLTTALSGLQAEEVELEPWLSSLHLSLRNAVRLRIEGERVGLPAPVVTPYLVGLLVMLGLLGTFLGMVDTLQGAVAALEGTTELEAIRAGLAAPINGLGLAFGTSVAGVAASAMLGLSSTLSRRQRMNATRDLDSHIAGAFRQFSLVHNRQQTFKAMQLQANALPEVAERLHSLASKIENMGDHLGDKLMANQESFHQSVTSLYTDLAQSVDQSLQKSVAESGQQAIESGRLAAEAIKPLLQQLMVDINTESQKTHQQLTHTASAQLEHLNQRFADTSETVTSAWKQGLAEHQQANTCLVDSISASFNQFSGQFEQSSQSLLTTFDQSASARAEQQASSDHTRLQLWTTSFEQSQQQITDQQQQAFSALTNEFKTLSADLSSQWQQAGEQALSRHQQLGDSAEQTSKAMVDKVKATSTDMLAEVNRLVGASEELVNARIESEANWVNIHSDRMTEIASTLNKEFLALREQQSSQAQQALEQLSRLETTAATQLASLGKELEEPMTRLIETASETPKAAAEVIGHLRREISNNIERDNSLLEERARIMEQLTSLSSALEQTTSGQREAIELMVNSSATLINDISEQMNKQVGSEVAKLSDIATTFTGSATEIADNFAGSAIEMSSLGESFGVAVNLFTESNGNLVENLHRIEQSLDKSTSRSDEQLAYYVAQAREIIDHSMLSQQSIFEQLQQLGGKAKPTTKKVMEEAS
ncbi:DUF802 domain-containing protein [Oceanicoccus sagamiensis]|uniref:DUF802 domain-containing protein n=1 Tax=Oceanicoccus sagamiensis TaxID=716816 RepID=A0A1X9NLQ8_9GAMM|nr:DUF802 domain-containing protein [Oceanicoccus sagamiensis]ARN75767.1 hypothetical protein BST96_17625 [Oceanicoccus sagamiensis]